MAFDFNGSSQRLEAELSVSDAPYTMHCFVNRDTDSAIAFPICSTRTNTGNVYAGIVALSSAFQSYVRFQAQSGVSADFAVTSVGTSNGQWSSVAGKQSSASSRKVYLLGTNTGTDSATMNPTSMTRLLIGSGTTGTASYVLGNYLDGKIAEVAIWNADLTDDEVISLSKGLRAPRVRPQSLIFYAPIIRELRDLRGGLAVNSFGSPSVFSHPRIYG